MTGVTFIPRISMHSTTLYYQILSFCPSIRHIVGFHLNEFIYRQTLSTVSTGITLLSFEPPPLENFKRNSLSWGMMGGWEKIAIFDQKLPFILEMIRDMLMVITDH